MSKIRTSIVGYRLFLLSLWSFLWVAPFVFSSGTNIVTLTLREGALRFWSGQSPYQAPGPGADVFHYPPFFAFAYGLFAFLPSAPQALTWVFLNSFVFWAGVLSWIPPARSMSPWAWVGLALGAMELDISLRYQQTNPLVTGLILLGLAACRDGRFTRGAAYLGLGAHIKIIPGAFGGALLGKARGRFAFAFLATLVVLFLLPMPFFGVQHHSLLHWEEFTSVAQDLPQRQLLDIRSTLERWSLPEIGKVLQTTLGILTAVFFLLPLFALKLENFPWIPWYTLGLGGFLLITPRVESPTFVFIAPAYVLFMSTLRNPGKALVVISGFLTTFTYTSAWPLAWRFPFDTFWSMKPVGTLILWSIALTLLVAALWKQFQSHKRESISLRIYRRLMTGFSRRSPLENLFLVLRWSLTPYRKMSSYVPREGKILDLGCGHGLFSSLLALESPHRMVTAVDHDPKRIQTAAALAGGIDNLAFHIGKVTDLPKETYDSICVIDTLHYFDFEAQEQILRSIWGTLPTNGTLVLREVDPSGGLPGLWTQLYEKLSTALQFTKTEQKAIHVRKATTWLEVLRSVGFEVFSERCSSPLFSDVLFVCRKKLA